MHLASSWGQGYLAALSVRLLHGDLHGPISYADIAGAVQIVCWHISKHALRVLPRLRVQAEACAVVESKPGADRKRCVPFMSTRAGSAHKSPDS